MPRDGYTGSRIAWASAERRPPLRHGRTACLSRVALLRASAVQPTEQHSENVVVTETRVLGLNLASEVDRPVCLQVVAGPRNNRDRIDSRA